MPTGMVLLVSTLFRTRSLQRKLAMTTSSGCWPQLSSGLNMGFLCSGHLKYSEGSGEITCIAVVGHEAQCVLQLPWCL